MKNQLPQQYELGQIPLTHEQEEEAERLQHGITAFNLLDKEDEAKRQRDDFLGKTWPGSKTRARILEGPAYQGDEDKLNRAIDKAKQGFPGQTIRQTAMIEHAAYLGLEAYKEGRGVAFLTKEDERCFSREHGKWRSRFATPNRRSQRDMERQFLQSRLDGIIGTLPDEEAEVTTPEPPINLEDRAVLLVRAINLIAHCSSLGGLNVALPDPRYFAPIYGRYGEATQRVDEGSVNRVPRLLNHARQDLLQASGYADEKPSSPTEKLLLERRSQKLWTDFFVKYAGKEHRELRDADRQIWLSRIPDERMPEISIEGI